MIFKILIYSIEYFQSQKEKHLMIKKNYGGYVEQVPPSYEMRKMDGVGVQVSRGLMLCRNPIKRAQSA